MAPRICPKFLDTSQVRDIIRSLALDQKRPTKPWTTKNSPPQTAVPQRSAAMAIAHHHPHLLQALSPIRDARNATNIPPLALSLLGRLPLVVDQKAAAILKWRPSKSTTTATTRNRKGRADLPSSVAARPERMGRRRVTRSLRMNPFRILPLMTAAGMSPSRRNPPKETMAGAPPLQHKNAAMGKCCKYPASSDTIRNPNEHYVMYFIATRPIKPGVTDFVRNILVC